MADGNGNETFAGAKQESELRSRARKRFGAQTDPIHFFLLSKRHPPTPYVIQAWWTSATGKNADFESPRNWVTACGRWGANQDKCTGGSPWPFRYRLGSPGRRPFLRGTVQCEICRDFTWKITGKASNFPSLEGIIIEHRSRTMKKLKLRLKYRWR